jgi:hypothetical protein
MQFACMRGGSVMNAPFITARYEAAMDDMDDRGKRGRPSNRARRKARLTRRHFLVAGVGL